jgi:hypothetical protein
MNKVWMTLIASTIVFAAFSGCTQKEAGGVDDGQQASALDETLSYNSAIADTGYQVTGTVGGVAAALTAGAEGSATSLKVVDVSPDDATGANDLADFLLDAKEADGGRVQAELRSLTTAAGAGVSGEFLGGVAHNVDINGDSGMGMADLPKAKAYILLQGLARVKQDGTTIDDLQLVQVAVTKGIRGADQGLLPEAEDDLEIHVLFPGSLLAGNAAFPGSADGFLYYYFENVKLDLLQEADTASVGSRLSAPPSPNVPPVANMSVLVNGVAATFAEYDLDLPYLNVTLDASNSTDADGQIEAYSWDVREYNATGVLVPLNKTSGKVAEFSFTSGGLKVISLRLIDEKGGIANATLEFAVNTKKNYAYAFSGAASVGGGYTVLGCMASFNCNVHQVTILYGAKQFTASEVTSTGTCQTRSMRLLGPSGAVAGSGTTLTVAEDKLTQVGKYDIEVAYTAQVACSYKFVGRVLYALPPAA